MSLEDGQTGGNFPNLKTIVRRLQHNQGLLEDEFEQLQKRFMELEAKMSSESKDQAKTSEDRATTPVPSRQTSSQDLLLHSQDLSGVSDIHRKLFAKLQQEQEKFESRLTENLFEMLMTRLSYVMEVLKCAEVDRKDLRQMLEVQQVQQKQVETSPSGEALPGSVEKGDKVESLIDFSDGEGTIHQGQLGIVVGLSTGSDNERVNINFPYRANVNLRPGQFKRVEAASGEARNSSSKMSVEMELALQTLQGKFSALEQLHSSKFDALETDLSRLKARVFTCLTSPISDTIEGREIVDTQRNDLVQTVEAVLTASTSPLDRSAEYLAMQEIIPQVASKDILRSNAIHMGSLSSAVEARVREIPRFSSTPKDAWPNSRSSSPPKRSPSLAELSMQEATKDSFQLKQRATQEMPLPGGVRYTSVKDAKDVLQSRQEQLLRKVAVQLRREMAATAGAEKTSKDAVLARGDQQSRTQYGLSVDELANRCEMRVEPPRVDTAQTPLSQRSSWNKGRSVPIASNATAGRGSQSPIRALSRPGPRSPDSTTPTCSSPAHSSPGIGPTPSAQLPMPQRPSVNKGRGGPSASNATVGRSSQSPIRCSSPSTSSSVSVSVANRHDSLSGGIASQPAVPKGGVSFNPKGQSLIQQQPSEEAIGRGRNERNSMALRQASMTLPIGHKRIVS